MKDHESFIYKSVNTILSVIYSESCSQYYLLDVNAECGIDKSLQIFESCTKYYYKICIFNAKFELLTQN
jgi:hypothetical protein